MIRSQRITGNSDLPSSYAGGIDYYALEGMKRSIIWCHQFYGKKMPINDLMYALTIIKFSELQKLYKE
tara:strand:- start:155 stop:358 length:204 start_codon:yes stop_codon:yes gene_type:complete